MKKKLNELSSSSYYNSGPVFLGLRPHYSLLAFLYKFDAYTSTFWSSGDTASSRTRSPCLISKTTGFRVTPSRSPGLDIGLAPHTNQRPGLFIRPIARHHCLYIHNYTLYVCVHARDCTETRREVDSIHFKPPHEVVWVESV